ncbi:hypothetical protein D0862_02477 [Hortaea werneckii]|uniref:Metallo-beta-lactamase domain-containing protein n=1 Tax=Hortaea werneckii TaxID=91943 RepID=A0A3M7HIC8_HORWE|nr:hypothetical protein D0862_02477 [Hortaea werneckii]
MTPPVPGLESFPTSPSLSFLLEHPTGRRIVWDLGIREDHHNYSPSIAQYLPTTKYNIQVKGSVADILEDHGVNRNSIEAVVWRQVWTQYHWHWDHIGDPSTFPPTTALVVGPGFKDAMLPGAPINTDSPLQESDWEGRELREIRFDGPNIVKIGRFQAFDYFGDGSFYLLDSPGHAVGHLCGLARTTSKPSSFILFGGDVCHYPGIFRPSSHLPIPVSITPNPFDPAASYGFCPGHTWESLQTSRGRTSQDSLYDMTFGHDIPLANKTKVKLQELDCRDDVFVIVAHDSAVRDYVPHFPASLNSWKQKGWAQALKWAFMRDLKTYWSNAESL